MGRFQEGEEGTGLSPQIQQNRPIHRAMARLVAFGNMRPRELAEHYGYSEGQISRIMGSPCFQAELARITEQVEIVELDMAKDIKMMTQKALLNLDEDLELDPSDLASRKVRQTASLEVLGIAGVRNTNSNQVNIFQQFNDNRSIDPKNLNENEIRDEVLTLTRGASGTYGS